LILLLDLGKIMNTGKLITLTIVLLLIIAGCAIPMRTLINHPQTFSGKNVRVKGKVISVIELDDLKIFKLKSNKYMIWITTNGFTPVLDDVITVKGKLDPKFYYQRDTLIVVHEIMKVKKRRYDESPDFQYIDKRFIKQD